MSRVTPPPIEPQGPLNYRVKIKGTPRQMTCASLGSATRYTRKLVFAGQSYENIYIDEYYGEQPTGVWYRYDNPTMSLIKSTI